MLRLSYRMKTSQSLTCCGSNSQIHFEQSITLEALRGPHLWQMFVDHATLKNHIVPPKAILNKILPQLAHLD